MSTLRRTKAREAVRAVRPKAARQVLTDLLDAAVVPGPQPQLEVLTALSRYGERLQDESEYKLAAHVYTMVIDYAIEDGLFTLVARTYERLGTCLRERGNFREAMERYRIGLAVAARCRDEHTGLRLEIALGNLHRLLHQVEEATVTLDSALLRAKALDVPELVIKAAHERGNVELQRDHYLDALVYLADGFAKCTDVKERCRIQNDIAFSFEKLGFLRDARDIWLDVFQTGKAPKYARWAAAINLMMLAYMRQDPVSFDLYRRSLEPVPMPARLLVNYWLEVGDGSTALHRPPDAKAAYTRAAVLAKRHEMTKEYEQAKQSLAGHPKLEHPKRTDPSSLPPVVVDLLQRMRALGSTPVAAEVKALTPLRTSLRRGRPPRSTPT